MPYFLYKDLIMDIRHTSRFNTINQASVLPHFSLMILSRIDIILPIQSEEERSIYLIQSSSSLPTYAASLAHRSTIKL